MTASAPAFEHVVERKALAAGVADLDPNPTHLVVHENRRLAAFRRGRFHGSDRSVLLASVFYVHMVLLSLPNSLQSERFMRG